MNINKFTESLGRMTDLEYLKVHYSRFCMTQEWAYRSWKWEKADILDIGAHWLHQSVLYAMDGHRVTAADFSITLDDPAVKGIASNHDIRLLVYEDLSSEEVFDELEADSIDVILFCEILEHITFNPTGMWKAIHRVLRPGGRIIITTPNFYSLEGMRRSVTNFISGRGGGIAVADILNTPTYSMHWKEYSKKEIKTYFELLSADFVVRKLEYVSCHERSEHLNWKGKLAYDGKNLIPFLRKGIYAEVDLFDKNKGININPSWY
jgi:2-polyprenyl-3-methyl-5-hydroxy-6-metoxy-1,4-benzoquinol methylase